MATYKSEKTDIMSPAESVFERLSNPENLRSLIAAAPAGSLSAEQQAQLDNISVTPDSITIAGGPVGALTLRVTEKRAPELIKFTGEGTPVPMSLQFHISPLAADRCEAQVIIDLEIPAMLKPMVNGPLQKMADQFGVFLRHLPSE